MGYTGNTDPTALMVLIAEAPRKNGDGFRAPRPDIGGHVIRFGPSTTQPPRGPLLRAPPSRTRETPLGRTSTAPDPTLRSALSHRRSRGPGQFPRSRAATRGEAPPGREVMGPAAGWVPRYREKPVEQIEINGLDAREQNPRREGWSATPYLSKT
jgi:hypothetical protein